MLNTEQKYTVLGIDTSNYTTSVSMVDSNGEILADFRRLLKVKEGSRGLRQSEAVFQHMLNFPVIFAEMLSFLNIEKGDLKREFNLKAVAFSEKPRPVFGSYMPCFKAGEAFAKTLANAFCIPDLSFSHQEGHIKAALHKCEDEIPDKFLCWHLSGGTCELLSVEKNKFMSESVYAIKIIGGSLDLSFGQLLDRIGVKLGFSFPAGKFIDEYALKQGDEFVKDFKQISKIKEKDLYFNISGIETQIERYIEDISIHSMSKSEFSAVTTWIAKSMLNEIATLLQRISIKAMEREKTNFTVFCGGVASSEYIKQKFKDMEINDISKIIFSDTRLSSDNAVGTALLGRDLIL